MVLLFKNEAIKKAGMTAKHAEAFQKVADDSLCIIMCRSVNLACTGLIEEGYASKGFKVKAKSCDWGAAAGFIAADPRFSKKGSAILAKFEQAIELHNAYTAHKDSKEALVPLYLSDQRVAYLRSSDNATKKPLITVTKEDSKQIFCEASPPNDDKFVVKFVLKKEANPTDPKQSELWAVYYAPGQTAEVYVGGGTGNLHTVYKPDCLPYEAELVKLEAELIQREAGIAKLPETSQKEKGDKKSQQAELNAKKEELDKKKSTLKKCKEMCEDPKSKLADFKQSVSDGTIRVMGVANPTYIESHKAEKDFGYKRAVTGDYDLFAIIALAGDKVTTQERADIEKENLATGKKYKFYDHEGIDKRPIMIGARIGVELAAEDAYLGNITKRIDLLRKSLNQEMQKLDNAPGRNMVHHSDEAGRPFDPELEYPVIAFVPNNLKQFITKLQSPQLRYAMEMLKDNTVFAVENHNDFANFLAAAQTKFAVMVNTSWVEPLKVAFKRGEVPFNCSVPQWQEYNTLPYTLPYIRLLFEETTPVAAK